MPTHALFFGFGIACLFGIDMHDIHDMHDYAERCGHWNRLFDSLSMVKGNHYLSDSVDFDDDSSLQKLHAPT